MSDERGAEPEPIEPEDDAPPTPDRSRDLLGRSNSPCRKHLDKLFDRISRGFQDQASRSDDLDKWWNCYHCELDDNQFYNGNATIYVPIIHDAIDARATRFTNQLFPASGRYINCTASDDTLPSEIIAIANHYISDTDLKNSVVKPLLVNGDIEGQYNLYIDWQVFERQLVSRETHGVLAEMDGGYVETDGEQIEDVVTEDVTEGRPMFDVLHDSDVLILPTNADSVEHALQCGGSVTILRRWSKEVIRQMADDGEIRSDESDEIEDLMLDSAGQGNTPGLSDITKQLIKAVGIRGKGQHALVFETWTMLPLNDKGVFAKDGTKRLCRVWFGINRQQLGAKRNPYWNDRCPLISYSLKKVAGVAKGKSLVEPLAPMQWEANDAANERADADHYGAMPIIIRKPTGEGGNAPLILNLAAVWDEDPANIKFAEFPDLSARARARVQDAMTLIFQSLGVNPAMLPQTGRPGSKRNQAEVAMEQQVDLLTTAENVSVMTHILTEVVGWIIDLDHQFRATDLTVRAYGEMGVRAAMIDVPPLQNRHRFRFEWCGAEQAKLNAAMMQGGTQLINIMRGLAQPLKEEGYQLRIGPALERAAMNVFGAQTGAQILIDMRRQQTVEAELENQMLAEGFMVPIHVLDNDVEHIQKHFQEMQIAGDPRGNIRTHLQEHMKQQAMKAAAQAQQQMQAQTGIQKPQGAPGVPGRPGVAGTPRMGAVPGQMRPAQAPPGQVHRDQMPRMGDGVVPMPGRL